MRLEHHLVGGYVHYISPHIIIIIASCATHRVSHQPNRTIYNYLDIHVCMHM